MRRAFLLALALVALTACGPEPLTRQVSETPKLAGQRLDGEVAAIADRARPGVLGVGLMNLESGEVWTFNGDRRFPMQSVFKAILGAVVLGEVDAGRLSLDESVILAENDISPPFSPIAEAWPARSTYTIRELLVAAVGASDNTAADVLMRRVGGPGALTAWLAQHHIDDVRVDRYERELQPEIAGLESFRIAWKGEAFARQLAAVPVPQRAAMLRAYLKDPRDTATPRGMLAFLRQLQGGELLSPASTKLLLRIMTQTSTGPDRIKAGLPKGATLAHKTGTARTDLGVNPAVNDVGIITLPDGRAYALAVFLSGATLDEAGREAVIADVARAVVRAVG
jgi:beta-lactamase class A